jgi:hypothetical protein
MCNHKKYLQIYVIYMEKMSRCRLHLPKISRLILFSKKYYLIRWRTSDRDRYGNLPANMLLLFLSNVQMAQKSFFASIYFNLSFQQSVKYIFCGQFLFHHPE